VRTFAGGPAARPGEGVGVAEPAVDAAVSVDRVTSRGFERVASTVPPPSEDHKDEVGLPAGLVGSSCR
jgi:hypothetical protein